MFKTKKGVQIGKLRILRVMDGKVLFYTQENDLWKEIARVSIRELIDLVNQLMDGEKPI